MLAATSDRTYGTSRVRSTILLDRQFRVHVLHRDRILFDSTFNPSPRRGADGATVYIVVAGAFQIAGGAIVHGPVAHLLAPEEFERITKDSLTFRSWGAPSVTIELRVAITDTRTPIGLALGPLALSEATWDRCRALAAACIAEPADAAIAGAVRAMLDELARDHTIAPDLAITREPEHFERLWSAIQPLYATHATSASAGDLARAIGRSMRQLGRDLEEFTREMSLGDGFRDAARVLRLRAAIVLLSAPGGTATEVAKLVGYKSLDAMGRAFRDAGLPAPTTIQEQIRYRE